MTSEGSACIYCQVEESEEMLQDTDGMEESGTREMWITPSDPASGAYLFAVHSAHATD